MSVTSRPGGAWVRALPAIVILAPALLSLIAWLGPVAPEGLSGFYYRADVSAWGVALVVAWYGAVVACAQIGFSLGRRRGGMSALSRVDVREIHVWTCGIGLFGTAWAYWVATSGSLSRLVELWRTQQFNTLRAGFEYGVGVPTLRYAAIIAGALSIAHLFGRGRVRILDVLSLFGLLAASFLASRLSLVAAIFVAATMILATRGGPRIRPATLAIGLVAVLVAFTALNYSRSAGTYRAAGVTNPVEMAALNAQAYLAAPTQVTFGIATLVMENDFTPDVGGIGSAAVLLPTYANAPPGSAGQPGSLSSVVEVSPSLSTNGALPELLYRYGWSALAAALVAVGIAAWAAGRFLSSEGIGPAIAGVLLYAMAEVWRIFLFNQGILHFLVLIGLVALVVGKLREPTLRPADARLRR